MHTFALIGVAYLLVGACASALAQAPMGTWSTAAPLPQPWAEHAVLGLDGKLYAIAGGIPNVDGPGMQQNGASTLVEDYELATDRWRVRAPLPRALTHVGLAALDGKMYAIGGFLGMFIRTRRRMRSCMTRRRTTGAPCRPYRPHAGRSAPWRSTGSCTPSAAVIPRTRCRPRTPSGGVPPVCG